MSPENTKNLPITSTTVKRVEDLLVEGEELLLVAQPYRYRIVMDAGNLAGSLLGVFGLVAAVVIYFGMAKTARPVESACILPAMMGLISLFPLLRNAWLYGAGNRFIYALTNRRAMIIEPSLVGDSMKSYGRREITQLKIRRWREGYNDLLIASEPGNRGGTIDIGFMGIPDADEVRQLMLETFNFEADDFWRS